MAKNLKKRSANKASLFDDDEENMVDDRSAIHHAKLMALKVKGEKAAAAPAKKPASPKVKFVPPPPPEEESSDAEEGEEEEGRKRRRKKSAIQAWARGRQVAASSNTRMAKVTHNRRIREILDEMNLCVNIAMTETTVDPKTGKQKKRVIHAKAKDAQGKPIMGKDGKPKLIPLTRSVMPKMTADAKLMLQLSIEEKFDALTKSAINNMVAAKRSTISPMNVLAAAEQHGLVDEALVYPHIVAINSREYDPTKNRAARLKEKFAEAEAAPASVTDSDDFKLRVQPARDALRPFKYIHTGETNWSDVQAQQNQPDQADDDDDEEFEEDGEEEEYDSDKEMEDADDEEEEDDE